MLPFACKYCTDCTFLLIKKIALLLTRSKEKILIHLLVDNAMHKYKGNCTCKMSCLQNVVTLYSFFSKNADQMTMLSF